VRAARRTLRTAIDDDELNEMDDHLAGFMPNVGGGDEEGQLRNMRTARGLLCAGADPDARHDPHGEGKGPPAWVDSVGFNLCLWALRMRSSATTAAPIIATPPPW
jgi:hypothetical protein